MFSLGQQGWFLGQILALFSHHGTATNFFFETKREKISTSRKNKGGAKKGSEENNKIKKTRKERNS
jgi:hypothetical protein